MNLHEAVRYKANILRKIFERETFIIYPVKICITVYDSQMIKHGCYIYKQLLKKISALQNTNTLHIDTNIIYICILDQSASDIYFKDI